MQLRKIERFEYTSGAEYIEKVNVLLGTKKRTYFVETYGCQMNVRDSQTLAGILERMGYTPAAAREDADAVIFNTCCVREGAEERLLGNLGVLKPLKQQRPDMLIMVCGCMMQEPGMAESIRRRFRFVDVVFGTHNPHCLPELMYQALTEHMPAYQLWEKEQGIVEDMPVLREHSASAWINIMYGCNNFCSYCIVPYVRGRERSRQSADILREARALAGQGVKEITLLGQNVNSYGKENDEISFPLLLKELDQIDGIERIRFMTSHPKDLSDELIEVMAQGRHICKYIHLPVQSGSNRILSLMNRRYTREDYFLLIQKLRQAMPEIAISTDIIVGFPTETEQDFEDTLDLYRRVGFHSAFTFIYSKRKGTPAAEMPGQVYERDAKARIARLIKLAEECTLAANKKYEGRSYPVLVEGISKRNGNMVSGRTDCGRMVNFAGTEQLIGQIANVKITQTKLNTLLGEMEEKECPFHR